MGQPATLGSQRLQSVATLAGQEDRAVDNYTSGFSAGVVTENMAFEETSVACETRAVSKMKTWG